VSRPQVYINTRVVGWVVLVCSGALCFGAAALGLLSFDVIKWKIKLFSARSLKESGQIGYLPPWALFDLTFCVCVYLYKRHRKWETKCVKGVCVCEPRRTADGRCSPFFVCFFECW
jgi:hypothetical protein